MPDNTITLTLGDATTVIVSPDPPAILVDLTEAPSLTVQAPTPPAVSAVGLQGPKGDPGPAGTPGGGGARTVVYDRATPAATWTIPHDLGTVPDVTIIDTSGEEIWAEVHASATEVVIVFGQPYAGKAYLRA